jgi:hypothetical protein
LGGAEQGEECWDEDVVKHLEVYGYSGLRWHRCLSMFGDEFGDRWACLEWADCLVYKLHCSERISLLAQACRCKTRETDAPPPCGLAKLLLVPRGSVGTLSGGNLEIDRC